MGSSVAGWQHKEGLHCKTTHYTAITYNTLHHMTPNQNRYHHITLIELQYIHFDTMQRHHHMQVHCDSIVTAL